MYVCHSFGAGQVAVFPELGILLERDLGCEFELGSSERGSEGPGARIQIGPLLLTLLLLTTKWEFPLWSFILSTQGQSMGGRSLIYPVVLIWRVRYPQRGDGSASPPQIYYAAKKKTQGIHLPGAVYSERSILASILE